MTRSRRIISAYIALTVLITVGGYASLARRSPMPIGEVQGRWSVLLDERFDGADLDGRTWNAGEPWETSGRADGEAWLPVPATREQVGVDNGILSLHARRRDNLPEAKAFTSAHLNTRGNFALEEGTTTYTEAKLNLPAGNGLLPQFWLLGKGDNSTGEGWPLTGEVDLIEMANANTGEFANPYFSVWFPRDVYTSPPGTFLNATHVTHPDSFSRRPELFAGWHTWGLYRSPERMDLYIDGKKQFTFQPGKTYGGESIPLPKMLFTDQMHLRVSLGVGGDWAGQNWDADKLEEGTLGVDHVRVWRLD